VLVNNLLDFDKLKEYIDAGYISVRKHPTLPLRIFNYTASAQFEQFWPHEVCQCRGLILDDKDEVVSRSQYKFFNLGQASTIIAGVASGRPVVEENVMVDEAFVKNYMDVFRRPLTITRKMDGQMGVLWNYGDQWGISTRGSFESDGAKFATEKWQKFVKYGAAKDFVPNGWTLIFEIIAKHLRIVVPYEWEGLCLLTAVNNETGEEMSYEQLHELWVNLNSYSKTMDADGNLQPGKPWCRLVEKFDIDIATAEADPSKEEEGYVVSVNRHGLPPVKAKIKLSEYKRLHKILTGLTPQMIWEEFALPMNPWLAMDSQFNRKTGEVTHSMSVPAEFAAWVKQWHRGLTKAFHENLVKAIKAVELLRRLEEDAGLNEVYGGFKNDVARKDWLKTQDFNHDIVSVAILLYNEREAEAHEALWKLVRPFGRDDRYYVEGKGE